MPHDPEPDLAGVRPASLAGSGAVIASTRSGTGGSLPADGILPPPTTSYSKPVGWTDPGDMVYPPRPRNSTPWIVVLAVGRSPANQACSPRTPGRL